MKSYAFVGESPGAPEPAPPGPAARIARGAANLLVLAGFLAVVTGSVLLGGRITTFHYADALVVVAVAIAPAALVLAAFAMRDGRMVSTLASGRPMRTLNALSGLVFFVIVLPGNYILYLNQALDRSPGVAQTLTVNETWVRSGRHGAKTYIAGVTPDVPNPSRLFTFYGDQPIALPRAQWEKAAARGATLVLIVHPGRFGFAWYEVQPSRPSESATNASVFRQS